MTDIDIYPPLTAAERIEVEWMADPRRDWPTRQEAEAERDAERRPACCQMSTCVRCEECDHEP